MTSILLNVILCSAVLVAVVSPLVWAIRTTHRDELPTAARATPRPRPQPNDGRARPSSRVRQPIRPSSPLSS